MSLWSVVGAPDVYIRVVGCLGKHLPDEVAHRFICKVSLTVTVCTVDIVTKHVTVDCELHSASEGEAALWVAVSVLDWGVLIDEHLVA